MVQFHFHWKALTQKLDDLNLEKALAMQLQKMYMGKYPLSARRNGIPRFPDYRSPLQLALQMAKAKENQKLVEFVLVNINPKSQIYFTWEVWFSLQEDFDLVVARGRVEDILA